MQQENTSQSNTYRIRVRETFDKKIFNWFDDLTIAPVENDGSLLIGSFTDQPALRGFLEQLWNLNLTVISIERI